MKDFFDLCFGFMNIEEFLGFALIVAAIVVMGLLVYITILLNEKRKSWLDLLEANEHAQKNYVDSERKTATIENFSKVISSRACDLPEKILSQLNNLEEEMRLARASLEAKGFPFKKEIDIAIVAKILDLGVGPNQLFEILRKEKILIEKGEHKNMPYQKYINSGHLKLIKEPFKQGPVRKTHYKPVCTPKGLNFIRKIVEKHLSHNNLGKVA